MCLQSFLKLLGIKMATFKITMEFLWNSDGTCEVLCESPNEFGKKNRSVRGKKRQKLAAEDNESEDDDADNGSEEEEEDLDSAGEESDTSMNSAEDVVKQRPKKVAVRNKVVRGKGERAIQPATLYLLRLRNDLRRKERVSASSATAPDKGEPEWRFSGASVAVRPPSLPGAPKPVLVTIFERQRS
ncbi:hypothetical protein HPB51_020583 [Rhipicephalus microplus]|uniref:Uncharacterized protein n=1 Tax=Rhipicephalus microplus TaxID=6941 RepID=A0A9J6DX61_RHIMP|nr:hypothetical protein HPB51_020583 [Rhipicephalus microplus]